MTCRFKKRLDYPYDVSARKRQLTDWWTVEVFCQLIRVIHLKSVVAHLILVSFKGI